MPTWQHLKFRPQFTNFLQSETVLFVLLPLEFLTSVDYRWYGTCSSIHSKRSFLCFFLLWLVHLQRFILKVFNAYILVTGRFCYKNMFLFLISAPNFVVVLLDNKVQLVSYWILQLRNMFNQNSLLLWMLLKMTLPYICCQKTQTLSD